jgi:hypothetical protein
VTPPGDAPAETGASCPSVPVAPRPESQHIWSSLRLLKNASSAWARKQLAITRLQRLPPTEGQTR